MDNIAGRFGSTAGLHPNTQFIERREPIAGDPDACLKLLKSMRPVTMIKAQEPEDVEPVHKATDATEAVTGPVSVTALIKAAHSNPGAIASLEAGYAGRDSVVKRALKRPSAARV